MSRIEPGSLRDIGILNSLLCRAASRAARVPEVHLFATLARQKRLFRAWLLFAGHLMPGGTLSRHDTEMVILRVAHLRGCVYERDHHARIGRRAGVDVEAVEAGPSAFRDAHRVLLEATDALVRDKDLSDELWEALRVWYRPPQLVELCMLVGHYEMLATTIAALRIERDHHTV